jgi:hypothetical protein
MRLLLPLLLAACAQAPLPPETDLPPAPVEMGPAPLAGGASLRLIDQRLVLEQDGLRRPLSSGPLRAAPLLSPDGERVAFVHAVGDGPSSALLTLRRGADGQWTPRTVIKTGGLVDRLALDDAGARLAFVWAGPKGGYGGIYLLDLADPKAQPTRLTNLEAPAAPGQPPADWMPLPSGPPRFLGESLVYSTEEGVIALELPRP